MFERLKEEINCVFERDPAAQSVFEIITTYPGFHANLVHRFSHFLWCRGWKWLGRFSSNIGRWLTGIEIHPGARIGRRFFIDHGMGVVIGETALIGDDCTLYHGVTLGGTSWDKGKRHPTLQDKVVIGAGAKVLGPISIGEEARVGSNSVVLSDVPAGATVVGIPGHIINQESKKEKKARVEIAQKMGFDAYGTTKDMPDPVANAIGLMLDHIQILDHQIEGMKQALVKSGIEIPNEPLPGIKNCPIGEDYKKAKE